MVRCAQKNLRQAGFSLIEVSIVTAIVLLLAVIAIPAVGGYVIENKVPKVGEELARFVLQTQINAQPGTDTPYSGIALAGLTTMVADSNLFTIQDSGSGDTVLHGLGKEGAITLAEVASGAQFNLILDKVNHAACPALASVMHRLMDRITIKGGSGTDVTVKDSGGANPSEYNAIAARSACEKGDVNTFTFTAS